MACILIIDDEPLVRQFVRTILERAEHTVLDAPGGREGMAILRHIEVDLVITDIFMPEKDGVEVLMELRRSMARPKIIAISGGVSRVMPELGPTVLYLGANQVLMKPFEPQTLLLVVQEVLNDHA